MISLMVIGFGLSVIGFSLITLRNSLCRERENPAPLANQVLMEGLKTCAAGLIVLIIGLLGFYCNWMLNPEATIITGAGATLIILGIHSLIQWAVQSRKGTVRQVGIGAGIVTLIGFAFIIIYVIYRVNMI